MQTNAVFAFVCRSILVVDDYTQITADPKSDVTPAVASAHGDGG